MKGKKGGGRMEAEGRKGGDEEGSSSQTVQSVGYLFSRSLLAASRIIYEALDEEDCGLESSTRSQIDKISVLGN